MEAPIVARLLALNREFYTKFGLAFSSTRQRIQPGVRRILDTIGLDETLLDLGCGNGELARELARRGHRAPYLGLDFSLPLLAEAQRGPWPFPVQFLQADLSIPDWDSQLGNETSKFDAILAFAVLHHIPGTDLHLNILHKAHDLLKPGGRFIHSEWQFLNSPRLRARIHPWEQIGLTSADVNAGDYLLDWRHGGKGLRYVHHFRQAELSDLATVSGFRVVETFYSDGEGSKLGLYQVWKADLRG